MESFRLSKNHNCFLDIRKTQSIADAWKMIFGYRDKTDILLFYKRIITILDAGPDESQDGVFFVVKKTEERKNKI